MLAELLADLIDAATGLLGSLPTVFDAVFSIIYDSVGDQFTMFGQVLVFTAGFALAWAGISLIVSYVGKLLNSTRGGRR